MTRRRSPQGERGLKYGSRIGVPQGRASLLSGAQTKASRMEGAVPCRKSFLFLALTGHKRVVFRNVSSLVSSQLIFSHVFPPIIRER